MMTPRISPKASPLGLQFCKSEAVHGLSPPHAPGAGDRRQCAASADWHPRRG